MNFLSGRTNRATYAVLLALYIALFSLAVAFQIKIPGEVLLVFICVPRLHDLGRSGWWVLLPLACEIAAVVLALVFALNLEAWGREVMGLGTLAGVVILFVPALALLFIPGQKGPNRFGNVPAPGFGRTRARPS